MVNDELLCSSLMGWLIPIFVLFAIPLAIGARSRSDRKYQEGLKERDFKSKK